MGAVETFGSIKVMLVHTILHRYIHMTRIVLMNANAR